MTRKSRKFAFDSTRKATSGFVLPNTNNDDSRAETVCSLGQLRQLAVAVCAIRARLNRGPGGTDGGAAPCSSAASVAGAGPAAGPPGGEGVPDHEEEPDVSMSAAELSQ